MQCIDRFDASVMPNTSLLLNSAIRWDKERRLGEDIQRVPFPHRMGILLSFKQECLGGDQIDLPSLAESEESENGFGLHGNPHVRSSVQGTLHAAHVQIESHIPKLSRRL